jgi:hypothetical protein
MHTVTASHLATRNDATSLDASQPSPTQLGSGSSSCCIQRHEALGRHTDPAHEISLCDHCGSHQTTSWTKLQRPTRPHIQANLCRKCK